MWFFSPSLLSFLAILNLSVIVSSHSCLSPLQSNQFSFHTTPPHLSLCPVFHWFNCDFNNTGIFGTNMFRQHSTHCRCSWGFLRAVDRQHIMTLYLNEWRAEVIQENWLSEWWREIFLIYIHSLSCYLTLIIQIGG